MAQAFREDLTACFSTKAEREWFLYQGAHLLFSSEPVCIVWSDKNGFVDYQINLMRIFREHHFTVERAEKVMCPDTGKITATAGQTLAILVGAEVKSLQVRKLLKRLKCPLLLLVGENFRWDEPPTFPCFNALLQGPELPTMNPEKMGFYFRWLQKMYARRGQKSWEELRAETFPRPTMNLEQSFCLLEERLGKKIDDLQRGRVNQQVLAQKMEQSQSQEISSLREIIDRKDEQIQLLREQLQTFMGDLSTSYPPEFLVNLQSACQ